MVTPELGLAGVLGILIVQRLWELRLARRNEAWARERGAVEHGASHYWMFFPLHIGWLAGFAAEAILRGPAFGRFAPAFAVAFVVAEVLRYWAIASLGPRWNTRILVIPDAAPVPRGPYRLLRHPNYVAVALELAAVPLLFGAWLVAGVVTVLNAILLLGVRIPAENRALGR